MSDNAYELKHIHTAFETNWIAPIGENITVFEQGLKAYLNVPYAMALSSGTASLHMALKAIQIKPGDVVLCQDLTFAASVFPVLYEQGIPVFIDSDLETWNMCPIALEKALREEANVKAVIVVHLYGLPANIEIIKDLCHKYNVMLIEDAAEALGATVNLKQCGTFGDLGIYSFNGSKVITTSSGGMVVTHNESYYKRIQYVSNQAKAPTRHYEHHDIGYNYRLSNVLAGIGVGQLNVLEQRLARKRAIYALYKKHLSGLDGVTMMPENIHMNPSYWLSCFLTTKVNPLTIIEALETNHIEARPLWKPMHQQPIFKDFTQGPLKNSAYLYEHGVCLPSGTALTDDDIMRIIHVIQGCF